MKKGILFLGCSFTWGEGLYFYRENTNVPLKEKHYFIQSELREADHEFRKKHRFARLVADELDTWEYTSNIGNGGSNIHHFNYVVHNGFRWNHIQYKDFGLFVWQLTSPIRDYPGSYERMANYKGDEYNIELQAEVKRHILYVNRICKNFERRGIKVLLISWPKDYEEHAECPEEFKNRIVHFEVEGRTYKNIDELTRKFHNQNKHGYNEPPITIADDFGPQGFQKNDFHLNLLGHKIVKDSIIKKLEQDNFKL